VRRAHTKEVMVEKPAVEHKFENFVEAISNGLNAAGVQKKLSDLEARRDELAAMLSTAPASHRN
jgi:hypothetical protein